MAKNNTVPTYETDEEVHAAREMHGAAYDRLVERKAINAPTREELPDAELRERVAKVADRKAAKGRVGKKSSGSKRPAKKTLTAKRSSRAKKAKTSNDAPASESASSE